MVAPLRRRRDCCDGDLSRARSQRWRRDHAGDQPLDLGASRLVFVYTREAEQPELTLHVITGRCVGISQIDVCKCAIHPRIELHL